MMDFLIPFVKEKTSLPTYLRMYYFYYFDIFKNNPANIYCFAFPQMIHG